MNLRLAYTDDTALTFANQLRDMANQMEDGELRCKNASGVRIMEIVMPVVSFRFKGEWYAVDEASQQLLDAVGTLGAIGMTQELNAPPRS